MASQEQYAQAIARVRSGRGNSHDYEMAQKIANTLHHPLRQAAKDALNGK